MLTLPVRPAYLKIHFILINAKVIVLTSLQFQAILRIF